MEDRIQAEIVKYLRSMKVFAHSVPNEGAGRGGAIRTMQLKTMGLYPGAGDLIVWWHRPDLPGATVGYLEVKTQTGKQSERQIHFQEKCEAEGIPYHVVRSVEDVKRYMSDMGYV